jgi:hypothetical protein
MSGATAIIVAIIGSVGAGVVYLWQKAEDRRERYRSEKQEIFKDYLRSMRRVVSCAMSAAVQKDGEALDALFKVTQEHENILDLFELYSDDSLRMLSLPLEQALLNWRDGLLNGKDEEALNIYRDTYLRHRIEIVKKMRADLFAGVEKPPAKAFMHWLRSALGIGHKPE